ncbi:acyltransferase family protein [Sulfuriroseicoccus oceanibius]|uniref:Acyltransferase n=1 Tax=Sulfuriroseicoccus oceanibius TaxID=2707525 RepID=A0A6B3L7N0_9BACT|nr:acyltransferase [Sulfuriroseicoccus oceanibius]QQL45358.1 acyltransferase [Sulfuriroseicoccus oceanibius]
MTSTSAQDDPQPQSKWQQLMARFARVTSSGNYMPEVDGLRFIAIMAVVLFHAHILFFKEAIPSGITWTPGWDWLGFAVGQGWFGVQVFFVISGFVLGLPFAAHHLKGRKPVDMKNYYLRRSVRIGVPYIIALTSGLIVHCAMNGNPWSDGLPHWAAGMLYSHSLFYDGGLNPLLFVSWTLEIEIQFYLLAPFLCSVFKLKSAVVRRLVLLAGVFGIHALVGEGMFYFPSQLWKHSILGQIQFFLIGILLSDLYVSRWSESPSARWWWDVVGTAAWLWIPFALKIPAMDRWLPILLLVAFTAVMRGRWLKALLSQPLVATIGGMCYSIYLFHGAALYWVTYNVTIPLFGFEKGDWPFNLLPLAFTVVLTLAACAVAYQLIERPTMRWRGKRK